MRPKAYGLYQPDTIGLAPDSRVYSPLQEVGLPSPISPNLPGIGHIVRHTLPYH